MDSGLPPLGWKLRILVEPLVICGKSDFFKEFLRWCFSWYYSAYPKNKSMILCEKTAYLQSSGSDRHWQAMSGTGWQWQVSRSEYHFEDHMVPMS